MFNLDVGRATPDPAVHPGAWRDAKSSPPGVRPAPVAPTDARQALRVGPTGADMTWSPPRERRRHFLAVYGGQRYKRGPGSPAFDKFLTYVAVNLTGAGRPCLTWQISATARPRGRSTSDHTPSGTASMAEGAQASAGLLGRTPVRPFGRRPERSWFQACGREPSPMPPIDRPPEATFALNGMGVALGVAVERLTG